MFSEDDVHAAVNAKREMVMTDQSSLVPCTFVDPSLTDVAHTAQSTEYEHVCVVVDQVVHT